MKPTIPSLTLALALALVTDARADANSLTDNLGPRETSVGESMRADSRGGLSVTLNPAGLGLSREVVFEGGYGYRKGDGASAISVSACDSTVPVPGCFYYHYFSAEPTVGNMSMNRRAHEGGLVMARQLSPRVLLGSTTKYYDYDTDLMGEDSNSGFSWDVGAIVQATQMVNIALVGYNVVGTNSEQYPRAVAAGASARPFQSFSLSFDAAWNLDVDEGESTGRYGGGAEYFITSGNQQTGYPLRGGAVYDAQLESTFLTGGLGVMTQKLGFDVGVRKQIEGGDELMITASLRFFGPRQVQGSLAPQF
jgi:hypothetical protein